MKTQQFFTGVMVACAWMLVTPALAQQHGAVAGQQSQALQAVSETAAALPATQLIWIDVRTKEEFDSGHLPGALHIPYEQIAERITEVTTDKNAQIKLYCRSGRRSGIALESLKALGFNKVSNAGGYEALKAKMP